MASMINGAMYAGANDFDAALWGRVCQLDLTLIKNRLVAKKAWTAERADTAIAEYRAYLYCVVRERTGGIAPPVDVDEAWHDHILHTAKYSRDCVSAFGQYLHHFPFPVGASCGGSTNCQDSPSDCALITSKMDYDHPDMAHFQPGPNFDEVKKKHFCRPCVVTF